MISSTRTMLKPLQNQGLAPSAPTFVPVLRPRLSAWRLGPSFAALITGYTTR